METKKEPSVFTISWAEKGTGSVLAVELNMPPPNGELEGEETRESE